MVATVSLSYRHAIGILGALYIDLLPFPIGAIDLPIENDIGL